MRNFAAVEPGSLVRPGKRGDDCGLPETLLRPLFGQNFPQLPWFRSVDQKHGFLTGLD